MVRGGRYFRIGARAWKSLRNTSYAKALGGRWNVAGSFGALYLNATIEVAAANARRLHEGELYSLDDLRPEMQPDLQPFDVDRQAFVDAISRDGLRALGLPARTPYGVPHAPCQAVASRAYVAGELGIAARSAAEATATKFVGEELAIFDRTTSIAKARRRIPFARWHYRARVPDRPFLIAIRDAVCAASAAIAWLVASSSPRRRSCDPGQGRACSLR